jgi:hypothetical protein
VRDEVNFEAWNGIYGNKIPDTYVTEYEPIGVSDQTTFIDATVQPLKKYMYYVVGELQGGAVSEQSNLVAFPLLTPPVTFAGLAQEVTRMDRRRRFRSPVTRMAKVREQVADARRRAARCQIAEAISSLNPQAASNDVLEPEATDLEILMSKLVRRLSLYRRFPQDVSTNEFCTQP